MEFAHLATDETEAIIRSEIEHMKTVSEEDSIRVESPVIESDANAHHLVSTIKARKKSTCDIIDVLSQLMPASSVAGVPRPATADLLSLYEPVRRNAYTGAIGYIGLNEKAQFNVAVRTLLLRDSVAYLHAGTHVTLETVPEKAFGSVRTKAERLLTAISHSPIECM